MIEAILNRFRGTGVIFTSVSLIKGVHMYAMYIGLVVGLFTKWYLGLLAVGLFMAGESFGWGKWVGSLTRWEPMDKELQEFCFNDDEGKHFPFIHYIANFFVNERLHYIRYCQLALALRGFIWWYPLYFMLACAGVISQLEALVIGVLLGIAFPVCCWIGIKLDYEGRVWKIDYSRGWCNQELVYGLFQGIALWYALLGGING